MTSDELKLHVLLVDDEEADLEQYVRDLPQVFIDNHVLVDFHTCPTFDRAIELTASRAHRFDLVVSDTYRGHFSDRDAAVLQMVSNYRGSCFCPLVVYSSGVKPPGFDDGPFLRWADKSKSGDIESAISYMLKTGVPQIARRLRDELDRSAGSYLWGFLETEWSSISSYGPEVLERIIRRRAAVQCGDMLSSTGQAVYERAGAEFYVYPPLPQQHFSLGDVLLCRDNPTDCRVVLTPHCYLFPQTPTKPPRAEYVLLVRAIPASTVLGKEQLDAVKGKELGAQNKILSKWSRSPAQTDRRPEGRDWYLPGFGRIPHSFCDFQLIESVPHDLVLKNYERIATLYPPFAEALQSCFASFYGMVGLPAVSTASMFGILS